MPARRQRPGLGLAVADDAGDDQVGVIERGAVGVREGIPQLAALVDRAGRLRRHVAGDAAGEAELREQPLHPLLVLADVGVDLAVGALEVDIRDQPRPTMPRAGDVDHAQVAFLDDPVEMDIDEIEARGGPPVAEQPRLDVLALERVLQERVVEQVDLPDRRGNSRHASRHRCRGAARPGMRPRGPGDASRRSPRGDSSARAGIPSVVSVIVRGHPGARTKPRRTSSRQAITCKDLRC